MLFKYFDNLFIRSNLFVAICATSLAWQTQLMLELDHQNEWVLAFIFLGTLCVYNLHRYLKGRRRKDPADFLRKRLIWIGFSGLLLLPVFYKLDAWHRWIGMICALVTLGYSFNFLRINQKWTNFRTGIWKPFSIVLIWTILSVVFPLSQDSVMDFDVAFMFAQRFFFLLAITLPFDIRDLEIDRLENTLTIPLKIGWRKTNSMALLSLLMFVTLVLFHLFFNGKNGPVGLGLLGSALLTFLAIQKSTPNQNSMHYSLTLESMSLIQSLLVAAFLFSGLHF